MRNLISEIRRRRVIPVAIYYVVGAWLILQVADILLPAWGVPPRGIQLIVYAALLGFPIALVFGWRYDLGRDGITRTLPVATEAGTEPATRLSLADFLLLAVMSLAFLGIGVWLVDRMLGEPPAVPLGPPNSVAVLSFVGTGNGADRFASDLTDRLITALIAIDGLKVTGRESSLYFADRTVELEQIARMLKVRHVVRGSVNREGAQLSVTVQLIRLPQETVLWAQTVPPSTPDVTVLTAGIAEQVSQTLNVVLSKSDREELASAEAGQREARSLLQLAKSAFDSGDLDRAIALAEQVLASHPDFARAHVRRATYYLLSFSGRGIPNVNTVLAVARESLDAAEVLGADDAEYHYARGLQARREIWLNGGNTAWHKQLEDSFRRAIALNPSDAQPYVSLSIYYRRARRYNDSTRLLETALDRDPLHPGAILQYSRNLSALERKEEALQYALRMPELFGWGEREVAFRYREFQQLDKAVEWFLKASVDDRRNTRDIAVILANLRARDRAVDWYRKLADDDDFGPPALSSALALEEDYESAYRVIAHRIDEDTVDPAWILQAARMALRAGQAQYAIRLVERSVPALADPLAPEVEELNVEPALLLASALARAGGNEIRVGVLSGMILNTARNRPAIGWDGIGLRKARVYALQGETEQAIDALQSSYDGGNRTFYDEEGVLPTGLELLAGAPRFEALLKMINEDIAVMRKQTVARLPAD